MDEWKSKNQDFVFKKIAYLEFAPGVEFFETVDRFLSVNHRCNTFSLLKKINIIQKVQIAES